MTSFIRRLALALVPVLIVLAAGEAVARAREPVSGGPVDVQSWRPYEADPVLGWAPVPGGAHVVRVGSREIRETSNSVRLLGPEISPGKSAGGIRVLLLGDSITEGLEVLSEHRFATRLQEEMTAMLRRPVEVLNAGRSGYQTDQEVLYYEGEGRRFAADLVVLVLYVGNDIMGNVQAQNDTGYGFVAKPRAVLANGELSFVVPGDKAMADRRASWGPLETAGHWVASNVAIYRAARTAWLRLTRAPVVPEEWRIFRRVPTTATEEAWSVTEALLARLRRSVGSDRARLVVGIVPDQIQVDAAKWGAFLDTYGLAPADWDRDLPNARIEGICRSLGLSCVDLLGPLRAASGDPYLPRGGHLDPLGHRIAAAALLAALTGPAQDR